MTVHSDCICCTSHYHVYCINIPTRVLSFSKLSRTSKVQAAHERMQDLHYGIWQFTQQNRYGQSHFNPAWQRRECGNRISHHAVADSDYTVRPYYESVYAIYFQMFYGPKASRFAARRDGRQCGRQRRGRPDPPPSNFERV
eukprot:6193402-Pleurochrysis_carterae.AAC.5